MIDPNKEQEYEQWRLDIKNQIIDLKQQHYRIIYLDEAVFTTKTFRRTEYTLNRTPLCVAQSLVNQPPYAIIFAISEEKGMEHHEIFEKSVNQEKFADYLLGLRRDNQFDRIALFFDNLMVHKTKTVQEKLQQQGIKCLFNVPYQPDYNPCESCLSKIKNHYKREKLKMLVNDKSIDMKKLINESIRCVEKQDIINSIKFSLKLINK